MAWLGLAWLGLAWLGLAWLGLAWLGRAWQGEVRGMARQGRAGRGWAGQGWARFEAGQERFSVNNSKTSLTEETQNSVNEWLSQKEATATVWEEVLLGILWQYAPGGPVSVKKILESVKKTGRRNITEAGLITALERLENSRLITSEWLPVDEGLIRKWWLEREESKLPHC